MLQGLVFDIREFTIHDGPGIRTTVFMKGCPLRCSWCHNPEGQAMSFQSIRNSVRDRLVGEWYSPSDLAKLLNKHAILLENMQGGITFSGGEPIMQSEFVAETMDRLLVTHIVLDTSGYGPINKFMALVMRSHLVLFDLKIINEKRHMEFTKCSNKVILENLYALSSSGVPFYIRIPLIPGVTDTKENLEDIAKQVKDLPGLVGVDLLPYNKIAPGKYETLGMVFDPGFDESKMINFDTDIFQKEGIKVKVL